MCRIGSQDGGKQTKNPTMCRTGSQAENEKRNDKESTRQRGRGSQCPAQRPGTYDPAQEPSMGYYP